MQGYGFCDGLVSSQRLSMSERQCGTLRASDLRRDVPCISTTVHDNRRVRCLGLSQRQLRLQENKNWQRKETNVLDYTTPEA